MGAFQTKGQAFLEAGDGGRGVKGPTVGRQEEAGGPSLVLGEKEQASCLEWLGSAGGIRPWRQGENWVSVKGAQKQPLHCFQGLWPSPPWWGWGPGGGEYQE